MDMTVPDRLHTDVVVIGAGPAGLCFARSLVGTGLRVLVVERLPESTLADPPFDGREIALTHRSVRLLQQLDVWPRIPDAEIAPLRDACVHDGISGPVMHLDSRDGGLQQLGYLVPNHLIRRAAYEAVKDSAQVTLLTDMQVAGLRTDDRGAELQLADGRSIDARLVVAADSRFSDSRRAMGIGAALHDFGKTMLVCRMAHEHPHDQIAREHFDYGATIALLPLPGNCSSVVLTQTARRIEALQQADPADFAREIEQRLRHRLGAMELVSTRHSYPLVAVWAERFVATRYALIGDAAVGMHPVTAHGFNLGLLGADTLAAAIARAAAQGGDIGNARLLSDYESRHRRAGRPLYLATNAIVGLYTDDRLPARIARRAVLRIGQRVAPLRKALVAGLSEAAPARPATDIAGR